MSTCRHCLKKRETFYARRAGGGSYRRAQSVRPSSICRECAETLLKYATEGHANVSRWVVSDLRAIVARPVDTGSSGA